MQKLLKSIFEKKLTTCAVIQNAPCLVMNVITTQNFQANGGTLRQYVE